MSQQTEYVTWEDEDAQRGRQLVRKVAAYPPRRKKTASDQSRTLRGRGRCRSTSPFVFTSPPGPQTHSHLSKSESGSTPPSHNFTKSQEKDKTRAVKDGGRISTRKEALDLGWQAKNIRSRSPSRSRSVGGLQSSPTAPRRRQRTRSRSRAQGNGERNRAMGSEGTFSYGSVVSKGGRCIAYGKGAEGSSPSSGSSFDI